MSVNFADLKRTIERHTQLFFSPSSLGISFFCLVHVMLRSFLTLGLFFVVGIGPASAQISIENYSDATNDRFTNDPNFIGAGFDFSGVALDDSSRWGTLISSNAALSVLHLRPAIGTTFKFFPGNDPNSTPFEAIVTSTVQVGSTDLVIAILDRNVAPNIAVYNFATEPYSGDPPATITNPDGSTSTQTFINTDPNEVEIVGGRALIFGRSPLANPTSSVDQAVGENLVSGYSENVEFRFYTDNDSIILEKDAPGSAIFLNNEAHVRPGDSGAPTFLIDSNNELLLLGANSFRFDGVAPSTFQSTGVTYTGNLVSEINTILSDNAIEPVLLGDCNLDGVVDFLDISPFIAILAMNEFLEEADINEDEVVDFLDIAPFINILQSN